MDPLQRLPRSIEPERDLWPGIQAALPRRRAWILPASLAAGVLVAALGFVLGRQAGLTGRPAPQQSFAMIEAAFDMDPEVQRQHQRLLRELPEKLAALPQASQQRVRDSLLVIQQARQDIETELGRDTGSVLLQELLISTYQEEMRLLTTVSEAGGTNQEI